LATFVEERGNPTQVNYYDYDDPTTPTTNTANLFATIFSDNAEMYTCNMRRAMKRLSYITDVSLSRINSYNGDIDLVNSGCAYDNSDLTQIKEIANTQSTAETPNPAQIQSYSSNIANQNKDKIRESCPTIY
jgi:hypothetical protein